MNIKYLVIGLLSGLTWSIDIQIINLVILPSVILCSLLHDFSCFLVGSRNLTISRETPKLVILGFILSSLGTLGFIASIKLGSPITGVIGSSSIPIVTYILNGSYNKKSSIRYLLASVILLVISMVANSVITQVSLSGCFYGLLCSIGWSSETVIVSRYASNMKPKEITTLRMIVSSVVLFIALIITIDFNTILSSDPHSLILIALSGCICYISYNFWYSAIKNLGAPLGNGLNLSYLLFTSIFESNTLNSACLMILLSVTYIYTLVDAECE